MIKSKKKIFGSETLDNPNGIIVTLRQAEAIANRNMPNDLRKVGFKSYVVNGERGFVICYGK
jgi:hypothetical protein